MLQPAMTPRDISLHRLGNQLIAPASHASPAEVVSHLGAMQAQDYLGSLWSIGLRSPGSTEAEIESAIARREIVRTWPMRGTLHFVAPADARWMVETLTPRIISSSATRQKQLELDEPTFVRAAQLFTKALRDHQVLPRTAMMALLEKNGISPAGQRGYHILWRLAQECLICFGPRQGKEHSFVLFEEWLPHAQSQPRAAALAMLARRYFTSHGPATLADFAWWSGQKITEARSALESISADFASATIEEKTYWFPNSMAPAAPTLALLPGFDQYLLGYTDRSASLAPEHAPRIVPGNNGLFLPTMVKGGRIIGTWKRVLKKNAVNLTAEPFQHLTPADQKAFAAQARRYGEFIGVAETTFSA